MLYVHISTPLPLPWSHSQPPFPSTFPPSFCLPLTSQGRKLRSLMRGCHSMGFQSMSFKLLCWEHGCLEGREGEEPAQGSYYTASVCVYNPFSFTTHVRMYLKQLKFFLFPPLHFFKLCL